MNLNLNAKLAGRNPQNFSMSNAEVVFPKKLKAIKRPKEDDKPIGHVNPFMQFDKKESQSVYWVVETNFDRETFRERLQKFLDEFKEIRLTRMETTEATKFYLNSLPVSRVSSVGVFAVRSDFDPTVFSEYFEGCNYFRPVFRNKKSY